MKLIAVTALGLALATPAMAQYTYGEPSGSTRDQQQSSTLSLDPESTAAQQQAELPQEPTQERHPGTLLKLRGGFSDAPVTEGDEYPENSVGLPERKKER